MTNLSPIFQFDVAIHRSNKRKSVGLGSCRVAFVRRNTCKVLLTYWDFTFIKILVIYEKICNFGAKAFKHDIQQV